MLMYFKYSGSEFYFTHSHTILCIAGVVERAALGVLAIDIISVPIISPRVHGYRLFTLVESISAYRRFIEIIIHL